MAVNLIVGAAAVLLIILGLFGPLSPGSAAVIGGIAGGARSAGNLGYKALTGYLNGE